MSQNRKPIYQELTKARQMSCDSKQPHQLKMLTWEMQCVAKVNVYSYGMVVLGMVTGKSSMTTGGQVSENTRKIEHRGLVKWVREKINGDGVMELWLEEIIDPVMKGNCDLSKIEILVQVALQCVEEDGNNGSSG
ncbi:hypothetical protein Vadar_029767 [Vaccinium darrowii]|uniref:Uncharacterized protein n=1 Tax=Vaccinium darrowii TaxID=229202 RepID=A0ACB7YAZ3_9ERIC|nr:hypothetical protein Vadar_029767 [Vaccinium darrowii]